MKTPLITMLLFTTAMSGMAQNRPPETPAPSTEAASLEMLQPSPESCQRLTGVTSNAGTLTRACEHVLSADRKFPNYLCNQKTVRKHPLYPPDEITSQVRFVDGTESYTDVRVNGRPTKKSISELWGVTSTGEFGSLLRALFSPENGVEFTFRKSTKLKSRPALLYDFTVSRERNKSLWFIRVPNFFVLPGYKGQLWVDPQSAHVMRIEMLAIELPPGFPLAIFEISVDFSDVLLGDKSRFTLPAQSQSVACQHRAGKIGSVTAPVEIP